MSNFNPSSSKERIGFEFYNDTQRINYKIIQNTIHENMALFNDCISTYVRASQQISKASQPEDIPKVQLSVFIEQGERALEYGQNILKILENGLRDYRQYVDELEAKSFNPFAKEETNNKEEDESQQKASH